MTGGEKLSLCYGPLGTAVGFTRKVEGRMQQEVGVGGVGGGDSEVH